MRRSQKIMSMILALLMLLSSLPVWAEGEPIVIVESVETPAPQAENTPAGTAAPKNTPAASESATSAPEPAQSEAAAPATMRLTQEPSKEPAPQPSQEG